MTEIAQLFESALRQNRASLLRKAAMNTVAKMPASTTLRDLLHSDAAEAIRELSLGDLRHALADAGLGVAPAVVSPKPTPTIELTSVVQTNGSQPAGQRPRRRIAVTTSEPSKSEDWSESREERLYKRILDAMSDEPLTIGQLARRVEIEVEELRGYLAWMKKMGKVVSSGRARATRYQPVR